MTFGSLYGIIYTVTHLEFWFSNYNLRELCHSMVYVRLRCILIFRKHKFDPRDLYDSLILLSHDVHKNPRITNWKAFIKILESPVGTQKPLALAWNNVWVVVHIEFIVFDVQTCIICYELSHFHSFCSYFHHPPRSIDILSTWLMFWIEWVLVIVCTFYKERNNNKTQNTLCENPNNNKPQVRE